MSSNRRFSIRWMESTNPSNRFDTFEEAVKGATKSLASLTNGPVYEIVQVVAVVERATAPVVVTRVE